jgi:hypothetical protein
MPQSAYPPVNHPVIDKVTGDITIPWRNYFQTLSAGILPGAGGITQLTGDVTAGPGVGSQAATLSATGVTPGTYGSATEVGQFTVDAKGRLTFAQNVTITGAGGLVCAPLTDGDLDQPELIFAGGDVIMVCS